MANFNRDQVREALNGISGILVTPFDENDQIVSEKLHPIVDKAIKDGVHILVANGNTSEYYGLQLDECKQMVASVCRMVQGRVPVVAGVGRGIHDACELARVSCEAGADALMIHQPPDPFVAARGVVSYVRKISEAAPGMPLILYLRNENIGLDAIEELCRIPGIGGVKWASPTPILLSEAIRRTSDLDIAWVGGLAETWAPAFYAAGARGFTSGLINVFPSKSVEIHSALEKSDYALARELIEKMLPFEVLRSEENNGANVTVVKAALQLLQLDCGATRPPSAWPMKPASFEKLTVLMRTLSE